MILQAMRTVGPHVAPQLCEIVKLRNKLARSLGYDDFYDFKVSCFLSWYMLYNLVMPCNRAACEALAHKPEQLQH